MNSSSSQKTYMRMQNTLLHKQIGNAVPVNLALAVGRKIIALLNSIKLNQEETKQYEVHF